MLLITKFNLHNTKSKLKLPVVLLMHVLLVRRLYSVVIRLAHNSTDR